ncbi:uncharacterized protein LOC132287850 [Cornus florida]|uniref:uncharacterized protein LOC132287850 n=1 Tax=Cornus florida TaxID=4283 RepID=UPI00289F7D9F|nr:uncharacterized protein LOC132287850 [Cornus florida]
MAPTFLCSPDHLLLLPPFRPLSGTRKMALDQRNRACTTIYASRRDTHDQNYYCNGRSVNENLVVLRKRIHEMKMMERNYEPPSGWMDWEKHFYTSYDEIICQAMGLLQSQLMNTRPSMALAMVALVTLSVPTSMSLLLVHLMEMVNGGLAGIHLS